jgi:DNA modification methylase
MHGAKDPLLVNRALGRDGVIIGGNLRWEVMKDLGYAEVPVIFVDIPDIEKEKDLCLRLNKAVGEWDFDLLAEFDESFLANIGFDSEELDSIFEDEPIEEQFDLAKELEKLKIGEITVQKGDIYDLDGSRLMCGDSTVEVEVLALMGDQKVDMVMTDPPYRLDYLRGKTRNGESTTGFGTKKNRRYLETESLPPDFTELWMGNVEKVANKDFSIICYENWKNLREIWSEMEKRWKVRNMIVWHLPNRNQGYAGKLKFFSKHDIAMVGTSEDNTGLNLEPEDELYQNEYETALFAISGKPHWESYGKDKPYCPTDFIEFTTSDEKSSGQSVIFGVKPPQILIPYIKVLTKRAQLVLEPFGGSGSTLIASITLGRRCFLMEKSPVYAEVILNRWERFTGKKRVKVHGSQQSN